MVRLSPDASNVIRTMVLRGQTGVDSGMYVVQSLSSVASLAIIASFFLSSLIRPGTLASGSTHRTMSPQSLSVNGFCPSRCFTNACCAFANSFDCRLNQFFASSIAITCAQGPHKHFQFFCHTHSTMRMLKMLPSVQQLSHLWRRCFVRESCKRHAHIALSYCRLLSTTWCEKVSTDPALLKLNKKMAIFDHSFLHEERTILTASNTPYLLNGLLLFDCRVLIRLGQAFCFLDIRIESAIVVRSFLTRAAKKI
jgi:hypothetical protein